MTGSTMFSFANRKRKPNLLRDSISDPLSAAETKYIQTKATDDGLGSPYLAQHLREEQIASMRPSLPSTTTYYDARNPPSPTDSVKPQRLQKRSAILERPAESLPIPDLYQHELQREKSSSTLRSYYDRRKSPLAVSQQTSASSARDFALRKACLPSVPPLALDTPCPQKPGNGTFTNEAAPKKRPSRLDFSELFPKTLPRSEPLLSPKRYTHSPPPLSTTSELPSKHFPSQTFLHDRRASELQEPVTTNPKRVSRLKLSSRVPSTARAIVQRPRPGAQNWFDTLEGEISEGDLDYEPEMPPDFIETAFRERCSNVTPEAPLRPALRPDKDVWPDYDRDDQLSGRGMRSVSPKPTATEGGQVRHLSRGEESVAETGSVEKRNLRGKLRASAFIVLDRADLQEQSVLCLSSSDDEDDVVLQADQRRVLEHRGPFLRDSLGIDSIDSDVEIGTAQAVTTSFLRTSGLGKPSSLWGSSSFKGKSKVRRLKAVKIPDRRSSRQVLSPNEHEMDVRSSGNGTMSVPSANPVDGEPLSSNSSTGKAPAAALRQNTLMMALTPQEATLLAAMRSKRAFMRQDLLVEAQRLEADEDPPHQSVPPIKLFFGHHAEARPIDDRPLRPKLEPLKARKNCSPNTTSTESSLPSGRVSLIFSESFSSPTTGRESPATPTLDNTREVKGLNGFESYHDPGLQTVKANQYGHARCGTGSDSIIVLDNFHSSPKENMVSENSPWVVRGFSRRANTTMIH